MSFRVVFSDTIRDMRLLRANMIETKESTRVSMATIASAATPLRGFLRELNTFDMLSRSLIVNRICIKIVIRFTEFSIMEPIVISGASGFLGSAFLVEVLRMPDVDRVILISRRPVDLSDRYFSKLFEDPSEAQELWRKVEILQADLSNPLDLQQKLETLAQGSRTRFRVFHLAAQISEKADPGFIRRLNVEATQVLVEWANQHAVRLVFVSSVAAFGSSASPQVRSERDFASFDPVSSHSLYFQTKREAHLLVESRSTIGYDIYCPSIIHGPWDSLKETRSRLTPFLKKGFRLVPPGGANFVPLSDILRHLLISVKTESAAPSRVRIVSGANWTFREYIENYLRAYGIERKLTVLPAWPFRLLEMLTPWLPAHHRSMVHGARYLFFRSDFETRSDQELVQASLLAVGQSAKYLKEQDKFTT